ncbi:MAG: FG-GAP-like repeat-containing protein [Thermoplasmatota archaeon]
MKKALAKPLALIIAVIECLLLSSLVPVVVAYNISTFSDGQSERALVFTEQELEGMVPLSIPRGTNISAARINLTTGASVVGSVRPQSEFTNGSTTNLSHESNLKLLTRANWWNASWSYRLSVAVTFQRDYLNIIAEKDINFSERLAEMGLPGGSIDLSSIRVVERGTGEELVVYNSSQTGGAEFLLPCEASPLPNYDPMNNINIHLRWLLPGQSASGGTRHFEIYFNTTDSANMPRPGLGQDYPEIIYSNSQGITYANRLYSNANGTFNPAASISFAIGPSMGAYQADINSDGYPDVVFPVFRNGSLFRAESAIYFGGPNGIDNSTYTGIETLGAYDVDIEDINNDGYQDIVFACRQNFTKYNVQSMAFWGGPSGFNATPDELFNTTGAAAVEVTDLNRDGWNDIVFACERNQSSGNIWSQIYFGGPDGYNETPDVLLPTQAALGVAVADLNLDGWPDIVFANNRNTSVSPPNDVRIPSMVYYGGPTGFNSTADLLLDTTGARDVEVADLNLDGWPDIVFANYNDGATMMTLSSAYFGSATGFDPHTPNAWFQTTWAFGLDVGDINLDGNPDVAFANYFDGTTYAINSTIFYGPCVGLKATPSVKLPTIGATEVVIADVDRYYMSTDRNSPVITVGAAEGRFVLNGTYTSPELVEDERILSATATWSATIPAQPAGCGVAVFLSNDAGSTWTEVTKGARLDFGTPTNSLMYMVALSSDPHGVETPIFEDITIAYEKESFPYNVTLDVGDDGTVDWRWAGKFPGSVTLNESTPGLSGKGLATVLMELVPRVGSGNQTVPLRLTSERPGVLRVFGLSITGNYAPEALLPIPDVLMSEDSRLADALNFNSFFRDLDGDPLEFSISGSRNVDVSVAPNGSASFLPRSNWYGEERLSVRAIDPSGERAELSFTVVVRSVEDPPRFTSPLPDVTVNEGESAPQLFNLLDYVEDEDTQKTALIFSVVEVSNRNVSVLIDSSRNVEVSSRLGWDGAAAARIKVFDGELSDIAQLNITVVRANRPPTLTALPSVSLQQGTTLERAFNLLNHTSDPDTPLENLVFALESNNEPSSGVTVAPDGWVHVRPASGWKGTALVVVNVSDGQWTVRASFTVTVLEKPVTPPAAPAPAEDRTLDYVLISLLLVLVLLVLADVGFRLRRGRPPVPEARERGAPPIAEKPSPPPPPAAEAQKPEAAEKEEEPRPAGEAPVPAPPEPRVEEIPPEQPSRPPAEAPMPEAPAQAPSAQPPGEVGFEVVSVEEVPAGGGEEVPQPAGTGPEQSPESAPELPPQELAFETAPEAQAPGSPETPAPPGRSAAELLAALQGGGPVEPSAGAPPPAPEAPSGAVEGAAPPAPPMETAEIPPPPAAGIAGEVGAPPEGERRPQKPVTKVRCAGCKAAIPVYSAQRPLVVTCPHCGRMGMLK